MQAFVTSLLRQEGALVEDIDPDGLEVLAPASVQRALGVGELCRLGFGATLPSGSQRVGLEGDWLTRFDRILGSQGRYTRLIPPVTARVPDNTEQVLEKVLAFDNATYRLIGTTPAWTRYLLLDFRISAVSDDKRDFMLRHGINLATGAVSDNLVVALTHALEKLSVDDDEHISAQPDNAALPVMWDQPRVLDFIARTLPPRLETALDPFIKGLRRRLARDQDRLHSYHNDLHRAAMLRALVHPDGDPKRNREIQRSEAIGREYHAKLDDLARQYATRVTLEWVQTLEVTMPVHRFTVQVRRRKAERVICLDWNPLVRQLEAPLCEATAAKARPRLVCDDALHLVVPAGLGPCSTCGRSFCRACHPEHCPKCNGLSQSSKNQGYHMLQ